MAIQFRKYLPLVMQKTRWGSFIDVIQSILDDITELRINRIVQQFIFEEMTIDEFKDLIFRYGFNLPLYDGYANSDSYVRKQAQTILRRIRLKTTQTAYKYIGYTFLSIGNAFPLRQLADKTLKTDRTSSGQVVPPSDILRLDQAAPNTLYFIGPTPFPNPAVPTGFPDLLLDSADEVDPHKQLLFLDGNSIFVYCNYFVFQYFPKFIENADEFLSENSVRAISDTVEQTKRAIEIPVLQPSLIIPLNDDGSPYVATYKSEDDSLTRTLEAIYLSSTLASGATLHFGRGSHAVLNPGILDVQDFIASVPLSEFFINDIGVNILDIEYKLREPTSPVAVDRKFSQKLAPDTWFSEVSLHDGGGNIICYAKFPRVVFYDTVFNSLYLRFTNSLSPTNVDFSSLVYDFSLQVLASPGFDLL